MGSPYPRKYATGTGADVIIPMIKRGVVDFAVAADWTPAAGDVKISKDGGAAANIGTLPVFITDIGWKFIFSDAELTAARININIVDSATKAVEDQHFSVETYGNAAAQHAFDFNLAEQLIELSATGKTDVYAEMVDVVDTDTIPELSQAIPAVTPTHRQALMLIYMALRDQLQNTKTEMRIHNNAGVVIAKAALTDVSDVFTRAKLSSGP